jgi:hypothetical protein
VDSDGEVDSDGAGDGIIGMALIGVGDGIIGAVMDGSEMVGMEIGGMEIIIITMEVEEEFQILMPIMEIET